MLHFVILCGGSGSRLWPKSRNKLPKQLLSLTNEYTMLQNTILRINKYIKTFSDETVNSKINIYIICNKEHSHIVLKQIEELKTNVEIFLVCEPKGRDSAPAICIASLLNDIDDYTIVLPCDHILDDDEFTRCCKESLKYLEKSIVTFGIKPTYPETGYGYIKIDENNKTVCFVEKPNSQKAKEYVDEGNYLWNGGIFAFKNANMITCFHKYASDILDNCFTTLYNAENTHNIIHLKEEYFDKCKSISVDYAIMELLCKDNEINIDKITIPYNSFWNDIGSFSSLHDYLNKDDNDNVIKGDITTVNTKNCYIESENSLVTTVDVENLVIVQTQDAVLVCNKDKTQNVKLLVDKLKEKKREEIIIHKKAFRPWGWYTNIEGNDYNGFKVKRIAVYPGKRLSLQSHNQRSEHWVIVKGNAKVTLGDEELFLNKDQNVYIPIGTLHRIENVGDELLEFTETQIGDYLGEDDIIRYEDDFGRS
jgi:mannose-1-phosphate guanylyltransferase/mannose-6-phosphate isomerase